MAHLQYSRYKEIFPTRADAIVALDRTSREFAETVAVKYSEGTNTCIMLALYKSREKGDYEITYDSNTGVGAEAGIYTVRKSSMTQTDAQAIAVALFGKLPNDYDIIVITSYDSSSINSYIYFEETWIYFSGAGEGTSSGLVGFITEETNTVQLEISTNEDLVQSLKANVKLDNDTLIYDPEIDAVRINKIYGGTF